ncbi:DUF742 domain-containing protein [Streptomyces sp. IBSNAI002]|uniref:DUF742 domain-containing protein n=1 Tax=Streptomyces sp. IBSNAI002 TaxID=3457500 RepID=UPI003FD15B7F
MPRHRVDPARGSAPTPLLPRPYAITGGRTEIRLDIAIEALVVTNAVHGQRGSQPEHDAILVRCVEPTSVAELSALLRVPIGVARVLVADLASLGLVSVSGSAGDAPSVALMERVLSGLHSL